ncbi:MAG: hypothetical protein IPM94_13370 [bacterium]|nr:hypothetical protein [bacterium]
MKTFLHLSRDMMDFWFNQLLRNPGDSFQASQQCVKQDISLSYLEYMRVVADRRTRLIEAKAWLLGSMARATTLVDDAQSATKELDSIINNLAHTALMTYAACKLVKPAASLSGAIARAVDNRVLVRESTKYWPEVIQFRAVWGGAEKEAVRRAAKEMAREAAKETGKETLKYFINDLTHILDPSFVARTLFMTSTPEEEFAQSRRKVEKARISAERAVDDRIAELDDQISQARTEMNELLDYIDNCEADT